jgi:CheY-like chemotaxis protein
MNSAARKQSPLAGLRVLVVEDESMVAMLLEDMLYDLGCHVVGPAARVDEALATLVVERVDAAVLDINIAGEKVFPVADRLLELDVPFVFATGYGAAGLAERHQDRTVLQKPYLSRALEAALLGLVQD